jgi:hypothetical protein
LDFGFVMARQQGIEMTKKNSKKQGFPVRAFVIGIILAALFAVATVVRDNRGDEAYPAANLIPVLPYVMLMAIGLLVNPLLRKLKIVRAFSKSELLLMFIITAVGAGLATFGLWGTLVPRISGLSNRAWNTDQSQWDIYAMPFSPEEFYISEEGTQAAAMQLYEAHREYERARERHSVARELLSGHSDLARIDKEMEELAIIADPEERAAQKKALSWPRAQAERLLELANESWGKLGQELDPQTVADTYEPKIAQLKERRDELREELKELNKDSFDEVDRIRKGLPEGQRAMPGFLMASGEGFASLCARIHRLRVGSRVLKKLEVAEAALVRTISLGSTLPDDWPGDIEAVADSLAEIASIDSLQERQDKLVVELADLETNIEDQKTEQRRLRQLRRYSSQDRFEIYDDKVKDLEKSTDRMVKDAGKLTDKIDNQIKPQLVVCERVVSTQAGLRSVAADARTANTDDYPELRARLLVQNAAFADFDVSHRRFWLGAGRWSVWVGPLFHWSIMVLVVYMLFMSFNTLIYRQWSHHEKLIYPIAEVTTLLAESGASSSDETPSLFRNGLFWLGVAVSAGILGWNHLAVKGIVPNISPVKLEVGWYGYVGGSVLGGLASTYFCIIFAVIGLTFLVPSNISFSIWFFEILYMVLLLVMSWLGYGGNRWQMGNPGRGPLGQGAMLVFGIVVLWTCRKFLLCALKPSGLKGLDEGERKELRISSVMFLLTSLALVFMLIFRFGANPVYAILFYLVAMVFTIGLMRAVTEGGILSVEGGLSLAGVIGLMFGSDKSWCAPSMFVPFAITGAAMFGGVKAFIASHMANSLKIRDNISVRRSVFHAAIWTGIITTMVAAAITLIIMSYDRGANSLDGWQHTASAQVGNGIKGAMASAGGEVNTVKRNWFVLGIGLMIALLLARQKIFGLPHPLGMVMLMNPVMYGFWGSIMIGWMAKSLVSKYCNKDQYAMIRGFFVGLVVGHLTAAALGWDRMHWHWG